MSRRHGGAVGADTSGAHQIQVLAPGHAELASRGVVVGRGAVWSPSRLSTAGYPVSRQGGAAGVHRRSCVACMGGDRDSLAVPARRAALASSGRWLRVALGRQDDRPQAGQGARQVVCGELRCPEGAGFGHARRQGSGVVRLLELAAQSPERESDALCRIDDDTRRGEPRSGVCREAVSRRPCRHDSRADRGDPRTGADHRMAARGGTSSKKCSMSSPSVVRSP